MNNKWGMFLRKGDMIGLTAPAGPVDEKLLQKATFLMQELGFHVVVGSSCYQNLGGYLAGSPYLRANELNQMFSNPKISAIFCIRGGYGSPQILHLLDYPLISNHPKMFVGYSDITALHIALQQKSHLVTIHGPMPASDLVTASTLTIKRLLSILMGEDHSRMIKNPKNSKISYLVPGYAEGVLTGGNLTLITSLLGTPFEIDTRGKILFLEDVGEEPYRIDRMLTQMALAGKFSDAAGIILGTWSNCTSNNPDSFQVEDLFQRIIAPFEKPTMVNLQAGHCEPSLSLPLGAKVLLHAEKGSLSFTFN